MRTTPSQLRRLSKTNTSAVPILSLAMKTSVSTTCFYDTSKGISKGMNV